MGVHRVLQRHNPVGRPVDVVVERDVRLGIEELRRHVLLNGRGLLFAHPDEDHALVRLGRVDLDLSAGLPAHLGIGTLREDRDILAVLVEYPPMVRTRERALVVHMPEHHARATVRADVGDSDDLVLVATEEGDVVAENVHALGRSLGHLSLRDGGVPRLPKPQRWDQVADVTREIGDLLGVSVAALLCCGLNHRCPPRANGAARTRTAKPPFAFGATVAREACTACEGTPPGP